MKIPLTSTALALCLAAGATLPVASHAGGLQDQMDNLFNQMTNTTDPGVFETQTRGALAGGRYIAKSPIMNTNFANLQIPSWKAGCGGVDLFGGSFSFINADQFVQLLRSVAANATGYAFQLALSNVFPDGAELLSELQSRIQNLNQMMGNSCQLAQGVVNDSVGAMGFKLDNDVRTSATITGAMTDYFATWSETDGVSSRASLKQSNPAEYEKQMGNIVWKELRRNRVDLWFANTTSGTSGSLDTDLLEAIMSMTGTVIVGEGSDDDTNIARSLPGNMVKLRDLIEGGTVKVYDCGGDTENCAVSSTSPTKTITLTGLRSKIKEAYLGNGSTSDGLIMKYATGTEGMAATTQEQAVSANAGSAGSMLSRLSTVSSLTAREFAEESAGAMALSMIRDAARRMITTAYTAVATSQSSHANLAREQLRDSLAELDREADALRGDYGDLGQMLARSETTLGLVEKSGYAMQEQVTITGGGQK